MKIRLSPVSPSRRLAVWQRDRFTCAYCQVSAMDVDILLEVDHVIAVAHGGTNDISNLVTACRPCNRKKGPLKAPSTTIYGRIQTTVLLTVEQAERIEALRRQWGLGSTASVLRRLVDRGLELEDKTEAVA